MNWTFLVQIDEEINKYIKNQSQMIFNVLYGIVAVLAVVSGIVCGVGILISKNNSERRKDWITAFIWVILGTIIAYFGIGIINLIISIGEKSRKETSTLVFRNIIFYYDKIFLNSQINFIK